MTRLRRRSPAATVSGMSTDGRAADAVLADDRTPQPARSPSRLLVPLGVVVSGSRSSSKLVSATSGSAPAGSSLWLTVAAAVYAGCGYAYFAAATSSSSAVAAAGRDGGRHRDDVRHRSGRSGGRLVPGGGDDAVAPAAAGGDRDPRRRHPRLQRGATVHRRRQPSADAGDRCRRGVLLPGRHHAPPGKGAARRVGPVDGPAGAEPPGRAGRGRGGRAGAVGPGAA